nr:hypothetical protein [Tanacetum cinerariifolium]
MSSSAMNTSPSHHSPTTPKVGDMHKEAHQAAGGSTSLRATSKEGAHPQLNIDEPIIISHKSEEEENAKKDKDTKDTSVPSPPSLKSAQIQELMAQPELSKLLASHDFASCLPTELKELPSKIIRLSKEIKELKKHIKDMEIKIPGDLIEIPTKLESFTCTISSLSSQVAKLKNIQWKPQTKFLNLPRQVSSVQKKLKTLDFLPSLFYKITYILNSFYTMVDNASGATSMNVPSAGQATSLPAEGEKNTKDADVVTQYYTKKLLYEKYYDKMLKRKKNPKITKCDVLTKKGPITMIIYREDGSGEVISNLKVSDLHLA